MCEAGASILKKRTSRSAPCRRYFLSTLNAPCTEYGAERSSPIRKGMLDLGATAESCAAVGTFVTVPSAAKVACPRIAGLSGFVTTYWICETPSLRFARSVKFSPKRSKKTPIPPRNTVFGAFAPPAPGDHANPSRGANSSCFQVGLILVTQSQAQREILSTFSRR